jgi:hypothetical protein
VQLINAYESAAASGVAYKSLKAIKDISPGAAVAGEAATIPAGYLLPGSIIRYTARGWYSTKVTTEPTFIMGLYWGGVAGKALAVTGTNKASATAAVELPWTLEATTRIISVGEKGKAITQGTLIGFGALASTAAGQTIQHLPASKPQTEVEINTATANIITLGGTWGEESAENTLTVTMWLVELQN